MINVCCDFTFNLFFPQAMALCQQGDEAVAVGLLAEALPDSAVDSSAMDTPVKDGVERTGDDAAAAASLLRKVTSHGV